jgi:hypothetical protein
MQVHGTQSRQFVSIGIYNRWDAMASQIINRWAWLFADDSLAGGAILRICPKPV